MKKQTGLMIMLMAFLVVLLTTSCSGSGTGAGCEWVKFIYASKSDTRATKRQVLAHNLKVDKFCPSF